MPINKEGLNIMAKLTKKEIASRRFDAILNNKSIPEDARMEFLEKELEASRQRINNAWEDYEKHPRNSTTN